MDENRLTPIISRDLLARAGQGEPMVLQQLDAMGLLLGPGEKLEAYLARLNCLQQRIGEMEEALRESGEYTCEDLRLRSEDRISRELLVECTAATREAYAIEIDWVPAFFINPAFSWLFGGCAYYFYPDMFALMIVRRAFARQRKWFIYDRNEILAHEMCHVARLSFASRAYEERFAYRISESRFRRRFGGVFESPTDSFLLLGSTLLLLVAQTVQTTMVSSLPIWPFWSIVGGVVAFLLGRDRQRHRILAEAEKNLTPLLEPGQSSQPVMFRCTDQEIGQLAEINRVGDVRQWLRQRAATELRWQVIVQRFMPTLDQSSA